tara:strand:- start:39 stop:653 length:615 start_codon:yes stop_codon:yes gene_type:complete
MSFTRNKYDVNEYMRDIQASIGPGNYEVNNPRKGCGECFAPVLVNVQRGDSECPNLIDTDSELMGLNVKNTKCPQRKYLPSNKNFCDLEHYQDCPVFTGENTRLSNPPCTLRGTGWNRWEWLCQNPQDKALVPFEIEIDSRLVTKDNHRPCIPHPLNPSASLPHTTHNNPDVVMYNDPLQSGNVKKHEPFSSQPWRKCNDISNY